MKIRMWASCLAATCVLCVAVVRADTKGSSVADELLLRRVADRLVAQTSNRLLDTATGKVYESSADLPVSAAVIIESRYNAWMYQTLMIHMGMTRLGAQLAEPQYQNYAGNSLDFLAKNVDYFGRQNAAGLISKTGGEGIKTRVGFYFHFPELWMTGLAPLWIERAKTGGATYKDYADRFAQLVDHNPRSPEGLLLNNGTILRSDDVFLMAPGILRLAAVENKPQRIDDAIVQVLGTHGRLFQKVDGLYRHSWEPKTGKYSTTYWGRGNGWMALEFVDMLGNLPANHPRRAEILAAYQEQMQGLRRWQDPAGGWHQVMDHPTSWIETSCTGMFVYALARGVNEGWLDETFAPDAQRGWSALTTKVKETGTLRDICPGTGPGDLASYMNRPRMDDDLHGYGPFLLAGAEVLKMHKPAK